MTLCVPAHLWGKCLDYLFYDEVERLACTSKFFRNQVLSTASRVNFRTIECLVREVSHVNHFHHCCVTEIFLSNFFSMAADNHTEEIEIATFGLTGGIADGARALSSVCAYQHVLAPGMPNKVILGHSWDYVVQKDEGTGLNALIPIEDSHSRMDGSKIQSLVLYPVDWTDEHEPIAYMPECVKFEQFVIQLTSAYECSLLSRDIIFEGIPFWHGHKSPFGRICLCRFCKGVYSFFPVCQRMGKCEHVTPGFFPYGFDNY
jgi:hypothetical protein